MVGESKILTVSYGTFSCTLEGFDDPFSTMRSIAEYFRDLAADDRYFGAEPPTPDAEMLHRIAEREVKRRVEARLSGSGIVLRQSDGPARFAASDESDDMQPAALSKRREPEKAASARPAASPSDSVAAKLNRIRAVVDRARSQAVEIPTFTEGELEDSAEDAETFEDAETSFEEYGATESVPEAEAMAEESAHGPETSAEIEEQVEPDEPKQAEAEGEILQAAAVDASVETDAHAKATEEHEAQSVTGSVADSDEIAAAAAAQEHIVADDASQEKLMASVDAEPIVSGVTDIESASGPEDEIADDENAIVRTAEAEQDQGDVETVPDFAGADHSWADSDTVIVDGEGPVESDESRVAAEADLEAEAEEVEQPEAEDHPTGGIAARIVKLNRAELEQQPLSEDLLEEEEDGEFPLDSSLAAGIRNALNAEAEASARERKQARLERRSVLIGEDPGQEPAFDRILEQTNSKMADSEGTRRRSAIAHLKAAVAATKADRQLKRERSSEEDAEEQSAYREDLAKVVRPRRSEPRENAADKRPEPIDEASAPLMLVSAQRIDNTAKNPPRIPSVVPRRISGGVLSIEEDVGESEAPSDESEFVAFAERMGARELPDVLEAAAAYTAFVERQPTFSRPQIMRRAASFETEEEFTREAGLRSFGQLLRQGKIRKLQRGQFTIAENTRFKPEARIAGE